MTRRSGEESEPAEGGRAAERLREFIRERFPEGLPPEESPLPESPDEEKESDEGQRREGS
jgi:hypothetical protein